MGNTVEQAAPADLYFLQGNLKNSRKRVNYTCARDGKPVDKRVADLKWRIQFAQSKLIQWRDVQSANWLKLKALHEGAVSELRRLEAA